MFHPVIRKYQSPIYIIMYIRILTIVALAICLWSCSSEQDGPFVPESKGIAFGGNNGTWQDAPTSRATSGLETIFNTFRVWGYKTTATDAAGPSAPQLVMDGYKVEYSAASTGSTATNTTGWEYVGKGERDRFALACCSRSCRCSLCFKGTISEEAIAGGGIIPEY